MVEADHVSGLEQSWYSQMFLCDAECQLAVPDVTFHVEYLFIIDFKRNDDIFNSKCIIVILLINYKL